MLCQHRKILQLLGELTDSHRYVLLFTSRYLMLHIRLFTFAKPSSGSMNYATKAHSARYIKYVINAFVNSKLWGNL